MKDKNTILKTTRERIEYEKSQLLILFSTFEKLKEGIKSDVTKIIMESVDSQTPFLNEIKRYLWMYDITPESLLKLNGVRYYSELLKVLDELEVK